jgi:NADH:ubiquinone oxidoreductase subunit 2 (subunit N)
MTILPFLAVCTAGAFLGLLLQPLRSLGRLVGLVALAAAFAAVVGLGDGATLTVGQVQLETTRFTVLFLALGTGTCLLLCLLGLTAGWPEGLAPTSLAAFGALAVALSATDPGVALIAAAAAAAPATVVAIRDRTAVEPGAPAVMSGVRLAGVRVAELRTLALVVAGAMLAAISALLPSWTGDPSPFFALALMLLALAVAVRCGVVPFHVPSARLSTTSARLALPLLLVWIPAGLAVVAAAWTVGTYGVDSFWFDAAIYGIAVLGVATLLLGAVGALLHDELEEIAAYSIVQDAGFIMLALATRSEDAGEPLRLWLLAFVVVKAALMAWVAAMAWMFGSSHLQDLRGWIRRAPLLALALVVVVAATLGLPGSPIFEARSTIVRLSVPGQLQLLALAASALALLYYGRLIAVGLMPLGERAFSAAGERPRWHAPEPEPARESKPALDLAFELTAVGRRGAMTAAPVAPPPPQPRPRVGPLMLWRANSPLRTSLLALAIAVLGAVVAFGGLGASDAARAGSGLDVAPGASEIPEEYTFAPETAGPTETASPTDSAGPSPSGTEAAVPSATPSPSAQESPSVEASPTASGSGD